MSLRRQAILNVASNWAMLVLATVISLFMAPFLVHRLGTEAYGLWALVGSLVGYLGLVDLGVRGAVTKYVSTLHAGAQHEKAGLVTSAGLVFFTGAALVVLLLALGMAAHVERFFSIPSELLDVARLAIVLTGAAVAVSIVGGVFGGVIIALQRFDYSNGIEVFITLGRTAAIVYTVERGDGIIALAWIQLVTAGLRAWLYALLMRRLYPDLRLHLTGAVAQLPKVVIFGATSTLLNVSGALINYSDSFIIAFFLPLQAVTLFSIGAGLAAQVPTFAAGIAQILTPMVGSLEGRGELGRVGQVMLTGGRVATVVVAPVAVALVLRGETFIRLWMGEEFAGPAGEVLALLALGTWALASFQVCTSTMIGIDRHRGLIPCFLGEALLNVLLTVILVPRIGITGAAWGTVLPRVAVALAIGPWYARVMLGIPIRDYVWQVIVRPSLAMIPFAMACEATELWWPTGSLWHFLFQVAAILPVAAAGAWLVALTPAERRAFWAGIESRWRGVAA